VLLFLLLPSLNSDSRWPWTNLTPSHESVHKPPISDSSDLTKFQNSRLQGDDIGGGWTKHVYPHKNSKYFYNSDLMIVTTENVQDRKACRTPAAYQEIAAKCLPFETWLNNNNNRAYAVDHTTKTLEGETPGSLF